MNPKTTLVLHFDASVKMTVWEFLYLPTELKLFITLDILVSSLYSFLCMGRNN